MRENEREDDREREAEKTREEGPRAQPSPQRDRPADPDIRRRSNWGAEMKEREREQGTRARKDRGPSPVDSLRADPAPNARKREREVNLVGSASAQMPGQRTGA